MHFETSPSTSPSKPISIRSMSSSSSLSSNDSLFGSSSLSHTYSRRDSTCAFPSWPSGSCLGSYQSSSPSSYISTEDLFADDFLSGESGIDAVPFLEEAPAPPRQLPATQAFPLMPLFAQEKPKKQRRRSSRKQRRPSKPMSPIAESPETPE